MVRLATGVADIRFRAVVGDFEFDEEVCEAHYAESDFAGFHDCFFDFGEWVLAYVYDVIKHLCSCSYCVAQSFPIDAKRLGRVVHVGEVY